MANNDVISQSLGIPSTTIIDAPKHLPLNPNEEPPSQEQIMSDFKEARSNILDVIETGKDAIASVGLLADQSQNNKYYDSLTALLKVMLEANRELMEIHSQVKDLSTRTEDRINKVQNNLFVGSTAELAKIIKGLSADGKIKTTSE